jgi:hypothetical protein
VFVFLVFGVTMSLIWVRWRVVKKARGSGIGCLMNRARISWKRLMSLNV